MNYFFSFCAAVLLSIVLTYASRWILLKLKIVDNPEGTRKIHKKPIPLGGGYAIYITFFVILAAIHLFFSPFNDSIQSVDLVVLFIASTIIMIGGFIDDKYDIGAKSFIFPLVAILFLLPFNIGIDQITNPLGGVLALDSLKIPLLTWGDVTYYFVVLVDIFTILWLLGMSYTTKLLDGLDGLVGGIVAIGAFIIFLLSVSEQYYQPEMAILSIVLCGACIGFLVFNKNPASIFLGEGGSVFLGFMLGVLAIISGGKIATALLVMGIPILDTAWVIGRRWRSGKSVVRHDAMHLHHRMLYSGLSQRQTVYILYALSFAFGITTLFLQSLQKIIILGLLIVVMGALGLALVSKYEE